ncbi:MAG: bifunctional nuclease domain-containing protein, partial [Spirochaetota bacterium]
KEGTFYAQLVLTEKGQTLVIDSRPSDSIALAVREKCPIFISEAIIEEASISVTAITEENQTSPPAEKESEYTKLQKELDKAVEEEDYEEAARLRDKLNELNDMSG